MASKRWQSEYAARLASHVSRREAPKAAAPTPAPVAAEPARAPGGFAAYARAKTRQAPADRQALAALVGVIKLSKTLD